MTFRLLLNDVLDEHGLGRLFSFEIYLRDQHLEPDQSCQFRTEVDFDSINRLSLRLTLVKKSPIKYHVKFQMSQVRGNQLLANSVIDTRLYYGMKEFWHSHVQMGPNFPITIRAIKDCSKLFHGEFKTFMECRVLTTQHRHNPLYRELPPQAINDQASSSMEEPLDIGYQEIFKNLSNQLNHTQINEVLAIKRSFEIPIDTETFRCKNSPIELDNGCWLHVHFWHYRRQFETESVPNRAFQIQAFFEDPRKLSKLYRSVLVSIMIDNRIVYQHQRSLDHLFFEAEPFVWSDAIAAMLFVEVR